jgi:hypothetical protein
MFWAHQYKGHHIHGKVEGNMEEIEVLLMDRSGPGFTCIPCKTYTSAKRRITLHVNRQGYSLCEIIRTTAWRMRNVVIDVDRFGGVSIGDNIYLQGDDADRFTSEAQAMYEKAQHVSIDDCYACLAEPYYDCLEN